MDKFKAVKKEIEKILPNSPVKIDLIHSELTLKWVLKIKPDAGEALKIAALGHDIERAVTGISEKNLKDISKLNKFKKEHSARSANIVSDIMKKYNYEKEAVEKVKKLIEEHEFISEEEKSNILTDADSLAFFDYNLPYYIKRNGKEKAKHKIKFMFSRMSKKAKKFVEKMRYEDKKVKVLVNDFISKSQ